MNILTTSSALVMNDPVLFMKHIKKQAQIVLLASIFVLFIGFIIAQKTESEYKNMLGLSMCSLWAFSAAQWVLASRSIEQQSNQCLLALLKIQNSKDNQLGDYQTNLDNLRTDLAMARQKSSTLQNNFISSQSASNSTGYGQ